VDKLKSKKDEQRISNKPTIKEIKLLKVIFDLPIQEKELSEFRGAIAYKVPEHVLFHNHINAETKGGLKYRYRYPLIQYKRIGEARDAGIICLEDGVEEIHKLFEQADWTLHFRGGQKMQIKNLDLRQYHLQIMDHTRSYRLYNWLALNQKNYEHYRKLNLETEQFMYLEKILTAHILSFAKGLDWQIPAYFKVEITELLRSRAMKYKGTSLIAFTLRFKANLFLPSYIGLGKGASRGFGVVHPFRS